MRTLDRITRGVERMKESGYIVERYENYSREQGKKIIIAVQRTDEANDTEFEEWLYSNFTNTKKHPQEAGEIKNPSQS